MQSISPEIIFRGNDAWEKALPLIGNLTKHAKNNVIIEGNNLLKHKHNEAYSHNFQKS